MAPGRDGGRFSIEIPRRGGVLPRGEGGEGPGGCVRDIFWGKGAKYFFFGAEMPTNKGHRTQLGECQFQDGLSTKFGKEVSSRNLRENRSGWVGEGAGRKGCESGFVAIKVSVCCRSWKISKIPAPIKIKSALPPPPSPKYPPLQGGILWTWLFLQKERIFPGAHKTGAAISGPRIARTKILRTRGFV